ncbi:MAG: aminoglycoside phosphotransferase family protein [Chitinophagaceae bacterium]|nr:aminoglycoside phosphotransferase family protein [Chitinophagaceae bacterium]
MEEKLQLIFDNYLLPKASWKIDSFGSGLINHTWLLSATDHPEKFIFQRINEAVFKHPEYIAENIASIGRFLQLHHPDYYFIQPLSTKNGKFLIRDNDGGYYRLIPFARGSHTIDSVTGTDLAYEAAKQFGRFSACLKDFPVDTLRITLPDFHNLGFRVQQYLQALNLADNDTLKLCRKEINELQTYAAIESTWEKIASGTTIPKRVIHHDTKISNCLFDRQHKGMAVIDLDTVMPGYYISDVGDMCRSYLCPLNEESTDYENICIRFEYFEALAEGYLSEMGAILTQNELDLFVYSGQFLIYMQALRFLGDFLRGNPYYPVQHPLHNLDRTTNIS